MKKIFLLANIFALICTLTIRAQVTIGINKAPHQAAVLDLQSKDSLGLLLPRVALEDTVKAKPLSANVPGMFVYNTTINDAVGLAEGVYFNDGRRWWPAGGGGTEPWMVSGSAGKVKASLNTQNIYQMGQVSINTDTLLPLTQLNVVAEYKGIMIPRLTQVQRDSITKKIDSDSIYNSLMIYNTTEDCYNYYSRMEGTWQSLCGAMGKALFLLVCDSGVVVNGTYGEGTALNSSNYIKIFVNVKKIGSYSIQAVATPDNGYFFETSGTFYSTGGFYITIPGTGQPKKHTQGTDMTITSDDTPDNFLLTSSSGTDSCKFIVNVINTEIQPKFDIACGSIQVQGAYFEDSVLTSKPNPVYDNNPNQISVQLTNIPTTSFGAVATLETNTVDGISFKWTGILTQSPQTVLMQGTGTPRGLNDKVLTITSNSVSNPGSCTATVLMLIPRKRMMAMSGVDQQFGYNPCVITVGYPKGSFNDLLTDKNNFGYNQWSILRFAGFNNNPKIGGGTAAFSNYIGASTSGAGQTTVTTAGFNSWVDDDRDMIGVTDNSWHNMPRALLHDLLTGGNGHRKVDIFMIGYTDGREWLVSSNANDVGLAQELVDFCCNGGILMICSEATQSNANFMNIMFNNPNPAIVGKTGDAAGTNYTYGYNSNSSVSMRPYYCLDGDPILAGPFNNILGRDWGEDASTTRYLDNLPLDSVVIYSGANGLYDTPTTNSSTGVTIFRHTVYPLIFIGDGGFNSHNAYGTASGGTICPFVLTSVNKNGHTYPMYPSFRSNFGPAVATSGRVDNASFTANAFAWCINQAEAYRKAHK